ncbi:UNVERIFIED_CONTAM: hypothetical protein FKN15_052137 [Acipenser sinensis]
MAEEEDALSIAASWNKVSSPTEMEEGEAEPSSEVALEACAPPFSSYMSTLMGRTANFLQVPWSTVAEPCWSVFRTQAVAPHPQPFPAFWYFMEEVRSSWDHLASVPCVLKQKAPLASLEGVDKLDLLGFPPVDSTIAAFVKAPNPQCRVHLKQAYTAEAQMTRLVNTVSILTTYMDGIIRKVLIPELVAELHLLSGMLLQISGLQGQALGQSLASLVVARKQLWLSQVRAPDAYKMALLDAPISPGHTFGPAVEEILQRFHREREASWQVAALLPPHAPARGRLSHWQSPQACTITQMVLIPMAPLGDLRHIDASEAGDAV